MSLARRTAHGAAWNFATVLAERAAGFAILALLLRVVPARDVGLIAIASAMSELAKIVANSGAGEQVQASPGDRAVEAGAFWSQLLTALLLMAGLWLLAPWAARLYHLPLLRAVLRVMALSVVMTCFLIVPSARLSSQFRFRTIGLISLGSTLLGGLCALPLAYAGQGVAALVAQRLVGMGFYALVASAWARWVPPRPPGWAVLRAGFAFSRPLMEAAFVDFIALTGYVMLLGLMLPLVALAQFRIAQRLLEVLQEVAFLPARKLVLPVLVAVRDDPPRRALVLRHILDALCLLIFFVSAVSGAAARPLVLLMFGPDWARAVPVFAILSLVAPSLALYGIINPLLTALGRVGLVSWYAWVNALSMLATCWLAAPFGLAALAWALAARGAASSLLFLLALRQGQRDLAWPLFRLLLVPLAGLLGARLAGWVVTPLLPAALGQALILQAGIAALAFIGIVLVLAPVRLRALARRLRLALFPLPNRPHAG
ncbi:oligosaccharide flippase family protein [Acidocella facilis]|uniref:oligosaccharide flippase family protein n=1 Tax=Acidocella facilis TaxID=525 RepID=UPI001F20BE17|nr:oligosaccharide flippase family protein [Acidocella facilis]